MSCEEGSQELAAGIAWSAHQAGLADTAPRTTLLNWYCGFSGSHQLKTRIDGEPALPSCLARWGGAWLATAAAAVTCLCGGGAVGVFYLPTSIAGPSKHD